jgi:hypothetical protein
MSKNPKAFPALLCFTGSSLRARLIPVAFTSSAYTPWRERCSESGYGGGEVVYEGQGASGKISSGVNSEAFRTGWSECSAVAPTPPTSDASSRDDGRASCRP